MGNQFHCRIRRTQQRGFTLLEMMIASAVLLTGVVAVAQLVPVSMHVNLNNRYDSSAVVVAQRELDQMLNQPLKNTSFVDADGRTCNLGRVTQSGVVTGNAVHMVGNFAQIDFTASSVSGYYFIYTDPNDPAGVPYEVRWAVISNLSGTTVVSKRFLLAAWKRDPSRLFQGVTLDSWVQYTQ